MKKSVARFYSQMYAPGRRGQMPGGVLGWLFLHLQRFELYRVDAAFQFLGVGERHLDTGCGDGTLLARSRRSKFREVYGLDIAQSMVERARATCLTTLGSLDRVVIAEANLDEPLPFPDGYFDLVTALAVIKHIFDPYFTVAEIHRILSPGGTFIMEVPNLVWLPRGVAVLLGQLPLTGDEEGWDGGHLYFFTFGATRRLLESFGFRIVSMESTGIFARALNLRATILGGNILVKAMKL